MLPQYEELRDLKLNVRNWVKHKCVPGSHMFSTGLLRPLLSAQDDHNVFAGVSKALSFQCSDHSSSWRRELPFIGLRHHVFILICRH